MPSHKAPVVGLPAATSGSLISKFIDSNATHTEHNSNGSKENDSLILPERTTKRPRTRSSLLRSPDPLNNAPTVAPKRRKKTKKSNARKEKSPVIDLTTEENSSEAGASKLDTPFQNLDQSSKSTPQKTATSMNTKTTTTMSSNTRANTANGGLRLNTDAHEYRPHERKTRTNGKMSINQLLDRDETPQLTHVAPEIPDASGRNWSETPFELNSSPIKRIQSSLNTNSTFKHSHLINLSSSPTKKRKSVAFSDNIASDIVEDYPNAVHNDAEVVTPRRSILKSTNLNENSSPLDPSNSSMWIKSPDSSSSVNCPSNPLFWQPGTIVQLDYKSKDLPQLLEGCIAVLSDVGFDKKFEVYATLNLMCKVNDATILKDLLLDEESAWISNLENTTGFKRTNAASYMKSLCGYAQRDIALLEGILFMKTETATLAKPSSNPFDSRILNQVLKLIANLLAVPALNQAVSVADMKSFYSHTCDILVKPNIPKSLVAPYLSIIKDCSISSKRKRLVFETAKDPLLEKLLFALLNMRNFVSSSLINEKFIALRNLIQSFPNVLAKNFHHWFPGFLLNLCDLSFVLYAKVISTGVTTLLEAARSYLDILDICLYTRRILESPLPIESRSWISENLLSINSYLETSTIDYVVENLRELIRHGHTKNAMDIWVALTLLMGNFSGGFENWPHLNSWLQVHKMCFNEKPLHAKEIALSSWKVIVYKICYNELRDIKALVPISMNSPNKLGGGVHGKQPPAWDMALRPKIKLLIHPFLSVTQTELRAEIVDAFHKLFLAILYNLFNFQQKANSRFFQICWEKIVIPILQNFYFKKNTSTAYMHQLACDTLTGLFKSQPGPAEKPPSSIRCLSNEPIALSEIHPFNSRWLHLRFDKVHPAMSLAYQLQNLSVETKLNAFTAFLNTMKPAFKKEIIPSDATYDLIDSLPISLEEVVSAHKISYEVTFKLLVNLMDAFGASNLIPDNSKTVYEVLLKHSLGQSSAHQLNAILTMLHGAVGEKKSLSFLLVLSEINKQAKREDIALFIGDCLNNRKFAKLLTSEMGILSVIFQTLDQNFAGIAKKLIQQLVLLKPEEFNSLVILLDVARWSNQIFIFFLILMQDAPYDHLKKATLQLLEKKLKDDDAAELILLHLFEQKSINEVYNCRGIIMPKLRALIEKSDDLKQLWSSYVLEFSGELFKLDDILVSAVKENIEIERLINDRWDQLPLLRAEWTAKFGLDCSESYSSVSGAYPVVAEKLNNMLEKEFSNSQVIPSTDTDEVEAVKPNGDEESSSESKSIQNEIDDMQCIPQSLPEDNRLALELSNNKGQIDSIDPTGPIDPIDEIESCLEDSKKSSSAEESIIVTDSSADEKSITNDETISLTPVECSKAQITEISDAKNELIAKQDTELPLIVAKPDEDSLIEMLSSAETVKANNATEELSLVLVQNSLETPKSSLEKIQSSLEKRQVATPPSTTNNLSKLSTLLNEISEGSLQEISVQNRFTLETQMMELMLRMRSKP